MEFVEHSKETRDRLVRQKFELHEYLSLQLRNYKSLVVTNNEHKSFSADHEEYSLCEDTDDRHFFAEPIPDQGTPAETGGQYTSDWFFVGQDLIDLFAIVTLDDQWIHTDVRRAKKESPFKATIAHGFLILSLIPHLTSRRDVAATIGTPPKIIINLGLVNVKFLHPLKSNLAVRAKVKTMDIRPQRKGVQLTEQISIECESGKIICLADSIYRVIFR